MVKLFHEQNDLLCVAGLGLLILNFKCCKRKSFNKEVLVDHVSPDGSLLPAAHFGSLVVITSRELCLALVCSLKETAQCFEEPHDLRLAEDVWENLKVSAEAREPVEVQKTTLLIGIVKII